MPIPVTDHARRGVVQCLIGLNLRQTTQTPLTCVDDLDPEELRHDEQHATDEQGREEA
jgi:hypothetical protein